VITSLLGRCKKLWSARVCMSVSMCVCLSVCRSVESHISKCPNFTKFSVHVISGCGSVLFWRKCRTLCTYSFVDDVTFSHNGPHCQNQRWRHVFRMQNVVYCNFTFQYATLWTISQQFPQYIIDNSGTINKAALIIKAHNVWQTETHTLTDGTHATALS